MKKSLLLLASLLMAVASFAQWTKPVPTAETSIKYSTLADEGAGDSIVYYLYNKDAGAFFTQGNAWGTQASIGDTGLKVLVSKYVAAGADWDGKTLLLTDYVAKKQDNVDVWAWYQVFIDSETQSYVDRGTQADYFWQLEDMGNGIFRIYGADINPTYNSKTYGNGGKAYYGVSIANNPATTEISPVIDYAEDVTAQIDWQFISEANYEVYMTEYTRYAMAQSLKAAIDEAKSLGVDPSVGEGVYGNTSATLEDLTEAYKSLVEAINYFKENNATPSNPQDLTSKYIPDADFEGGSASSIWSRTHSAQNYQTSGTAGKMGDNTTFLEAWNGSAFTGKMYITIEDLPNGVYQFTLSAATNGGNGCYVYAGSDSIEVTTGSNMTPYTVFTRVENGTLEVGLNMPNEVQNWVGIDDAKLLYLGNSAASYQYWLKTNMESAPDYSKAFVQKDALAAFEAVLATDLSAMTADEVIAFLPVYEEALETMKANADAYAQYAGLLQQIEDLSVAGYEGEPADLIYDYAAVDADEIKSECALSTEEMLAECAKLEAMIEKVKSECLAEGMECTNLLTNPNFNNRLTGWSWDKSLGSPAWGGLDSNPCVERWNESFNFYQTVAGVPNGVYELKVQAFYRPTGSTSESYQNYLSDPTTDEILCKIYANSTEAPVRNIGAHAYDTNLEGNCEASTDASGKTVYIPNGMNSASAAFSRGDYECSVMGVVTDGVLTVGIKETSGTIGGRWPLWDNFRLVYQGKNYEAIMDVILSYADEVEAFADETMGADELDDVTEAYSQAEGAEDGDEAFDALVKLIDAVNAAKASIEKYSALLDAIEELSVVIDEYESTADEQALNSAAELLDEISTGVGDLAYNNADCDAKLGAVKDAIAAIVFGGASPENPSDITSLYIVNPDFETQNAQGWTVSFAAVSNYGYQGASYANGDVTIEHFVEAWRNNAKLGDGAISQTISNLPAGTYILGVDAIATWQNGTKDTTSGLSLFATINGETQAIEIATGNEAPEHFELTFTVAETSDVTIGISAKSATANWIAADNWTLKCIESSFTTAIAGVNTTAAPAAIYSISGVRVNNLQKGVNIVRQADGTVQKVLVK